MVDGKKKGGAYERAKSRALSLWFTLGERDDIFWRTSGSGAKATVNLESGTRVDLNYFGDIGARGRVGQEFIERVNIECKAYKSFYLMDVLKENKNPCELDIFWNEACKEANDSGRWPVLIMKKNYFPEMIAVDYEGIFKHFEDKFEDDEFIFYRSGAILKLEKFLDRVNPSDFVENVKIREVV